MFFGKFEMQLLNNCLSFLGFKSLRSNTRCKLLVLLHFAQSSLNQSLHLDILTKSDHQIWILDFVLFYSLSFNFFLAFVTYLKFIVPYSLIFFANFNEVLQGEIYSEHMTIGTKALLSLIAVKFSRFSAWQTSLFVANQSFSTITTIFFFFLFYVCGIKWPLFIQYTLLCLFIDTTSFTITHIFIILVFRVLFDIVSVFSPSLLCRLCIWIVSDIAVFGIDLLIQFLARTNSRFLFQRCIPVDLGPNVAISIHLWHHEAQSASASARHARQTTCQTVPSNHFLSPPSNRFVKLFH